MAMGEKIVTFAKRLSLFLLVLSTCAWAQMTPTRSQHHRLMAARQKLFTLQAKISNLQAEQVFVNAEVLALCRQVVVDNRWPQDTECDLNSLTFYSKPLPPAKAEEPKPEQKPEPTSQAACDATHTFCSDATVAGSAVVVDNRWPQDTECDLNSLTFYSKPLPPAKAEEPKPEQKKEEPKADKK